MQIDGRTAIAATTIAAEAVGILSRPAELIPWAVLGLIGGALAVRFGAAPRPARSFILWSIARSVFLGTVTAAALLDWGVSQGMTMLACALVAYFAEHLLSGLAVIAGSWATKPLSTWRVVRGLQAPEEIGHVTTDHRRDE